MADSPPLNIFKKPLKLYLLIGTLLFIFTGVTVAVATVPWSGLLVHHGFDHVDMTIIGLLLLPRFKASLVMLDFHAP